MGKSTHETITATELVRNLSGIIEEVRMSGHSLYITKGAQTVAELSPPPKAGLPIARLAALIASLTKLGDDAIDMAKDVKKVRDQANLPKNPWT